MLSPPLPFFGPIFLGVCIQVNRAGVPVRLGTGMGANNYYCGRVLGVKLIPLSDGQCGAYDGPQCMDCRGLTRASPPNARTVGLLIVVAVPVVVLYGPLLPRPYQSLFNRLHFTVVIQPNYDACAFFYWIFLHCSMCRISSYL